ncbi:MAG: hypothetical protein PHH49_07455 [Candidatus Omnitrophica bacterium]|nr:hypothetical protein [Candidatus Omnitrophota bacterium]MDD5488771.1 hypothetical protein [Candidatus Omnitrophota bacterium]
MFSPKEKAVLQALIEEEIIKAELIGHRSGYSVLNKYLDTLFGIEEKLDAKDPSKVYTL